MYVQVGNLVFQPSYAGIHELRSLLSSSSHILACMLNMIDNKLVHRSCERSNILFVMKNQTVIWNV